MLNRLRNTKFVKWIRYVREQLQNQKEGREQIGVDRDGNKYYQYYSYWGLPTRRQIQWKNKGSYAMTDLAYYRWLYKIDFDPPTQAEKQQFYLEEKIRYEKALEWDTKEKKLVEDFKKRREELLLRDQAMRELEKELNAKTQLSIESKRKD